MAGDGPLVVAVIDDDAGACAGMARLLRAVGMRADTYGSAEAYLAAPGHGDYDGLVVDVRMVGMSGLELQRRLASSRPGIPLVFVTAHDDPQTRREAERLGCAAFVGKTESGQVVIAALRAGAARYRAGTAVLPPA